MKFTPDIIKYFIYRMSIKRFVLPIWVVYMVDQGLSIQQIAIIAGIAAITAFVLEVPSGSIADHIGHRRACVLSNILCGISMLLFLGGTFPWILAGSVGYWAFSTLMSGTLSALIFEHLQSLGREKDFQKLQGYSRSAAAIFSMFAVGIAGFTYVISPTLTFVIGAFVFFIGSIALATFTDPPQKESVEKLEGFTALFSHFGTALNNVKNEPRLFWLLITSGIILGFTVGGGEFQQIIFSNIGIAAGIIGLLYAWKRAFSAALSPIIHRLSNRFSPPIVLTITAVSTFSYFALIGFVTNPFIVALVILCASFPWIINGIILSDYLNRLTPTGSRATTLSLSNFAHFSVKLICIAIIGGVSAAIPIEITHFYLGLAFAVIMAALLPFLYRAFRENPL